MSKKLLIATVATTLTVLAQSSSVAEMPPTSPGAPPAGNRWAGKKWKIRFFHDEINSSFTINDFQFAGPRYGIAVGVRNDKGKVHSVALVTRDGGGKWAFVPLKAPAISVFALEDGRTWAVSEKDIYYSEEAGADWRKLKRPEGVGRVYFLRDGLKGWAFGAGKTFYQTKDGGKEWTEVEESKGLPTTDEYTSFHWMEFINEKVGIVAGNSQRPRKGMQRGPDWMFPELSVYRREVPTTLITMETRDGGTTWKHHVSSIFGSIVRIRANMPWGLALFAYSGGGIDWSSEVLELNFSNGKNRPVFRRKDLNVTDVSLTPPGRVALAGLTVQGKFRESGVPTKPRVLVSDDRENWFELPVDYRAFGTRALLSWVDDDNAWMATSEGMILKLEKVL